MSAVEVCSTYSANRRHLSRNLLAGPANVPGRMGTTLCYYTAYDLPRLAWHGEAVTYDGLPRCKNCEKVRTRTGEEAPEGWNP